MQVKTQSMSGQCRVVLLKLFTHAVPCNLGLMTFPVPWEAGGVPAQVIAFLHRGNLSDVKISLRICQYDQ